MATNKKAIKAPAMPPPSAEDLRYRAQEDLRTLDRADQIRRDRERMGGVKAEAKRMVKAVLPTKRRTK